VVSFLPKIIVVAFASSVALSKEWRYRASEEEEEEPVILFSLWIFFFAFLFFSSREE
jgi:hypothetical protein